MLIRGLALLAALSACAVAGGEKDNAETIAGTYTQAADRLIDAALSSNAGLDRLQYLCDRIGNRLSGSLALVKAVEWSVDEMKGVGLQNVHMITTNVPRWIRGSESASLVEPLQKSLFMLGLGGSVATPRGGITAEIAVVSSFAELDKLGERAVTGKIVVFDVPYVEYGETVIYRVSGASRAARLGAVGVLVRSITPHSLRDPHTGALNYESTEAKIPAAAITVEDAIYLHRLVQSGQRVRVHLQMESHFEPDATSADVTGDIIGREKPDEVVVIGGHLDSWDVGQGAHDDGAGVMAALEAAALIKRLGIQPRRTIRVVFWTNEENGGKGGLAYRSFVGRDVTKHVAAIEMDGGAEAPIGFDLALSPKPHGMHTAIWDNMQEKASAIGGLLKRIDAGRVLPGEGEADIEPLMKDGVPGFGLRTVMTRYFDYHHTQADTFDKIVPDEFRRCTAAMAVMSYVLADWP
jgi:hypothetical protein